jgi:CMP-N-acetylneuraminic acid synthetase
VVSTDSPEIKEYAQSMGAIVIDRPHELTLCTASPAVVHAIENLHGYEIDHFLSVLPTSPARLPWDMDNLIALSVTEHAENAGTVCEQLETLIYEPSEGKKMKLLYFAKHHEAYVDGGGLSCSQVEWYKEYTNNLAWTDAELDAQIRDHLPNQEYIQYIMKEWQTVELDLPEHWGVAEAVMRHYILDPLGEDCYQKYKNSEKVWRQ